MKTSKFLLFLLFSLILCHAGFSLSVKHPPLPSSIVADSSLHPIVDALEELARSHASHPTDVIPVVAIGGPAGVGKTFLTRILSHKLEERQIRFAILSQDDFNLSAAERKLLGTQWDPSHLKVKELQRALAAIAANQKQILKPTCNQLTGETGIELWDLEGVDLVLFEGHYALSSDPSLSFFDVCRFGIYLEADMQDISLWKWEREQKKSFPRTEEQFALHMKALMTDFHLYVDPSKQNALFWIQKEADHTYHISYIPLEERAKNKKLDALFTGLALFKSLLF